MSDAPCTHSIVALRAAALAPTKAWVVDLVVRPNSQTIQGRPRMKGAYYYLKGKQPCMLQAENGLEAALP